MEIAEVREAKKKFESKILSLIKEFENETKTHVDSIGIESIKMYNVSVGLGNHHEYNQPVNVVINISI